MSRFLRQLDADYPIQITARCNNKEIFPVPLDEAWDLFSNYLHFIHSAFEIKIHSFVLMSNHFHLIASDPNLNLSKAMGIFMKEIGNRIGSIGFGDHRIIQA